MPLPSPYGGGILGNLGNFFANIGGAMNPAINQNNMAMQAYSGLAGNPDVGPNEGSLLMTNPQAFEGLWKMQIYGQQYAALKRSGIPDDKIAAIMGGFTGPAAESQFGAPKQYQGPEVSETGFKPAGPLWVNGRLEWPGSPGNPGNNPQPVGQTAQPPNPPRGTAAPIATPGQGGAAGSATGLQPPPGIPSDAWQTMQALQQLKAQGAGATKAAETQAAAAPGFPGAFVQAKSLVDQLDALDKDPNLGKVVGRISGSLPAQWSAAPDTVNTINTIQGQLLGQVFSNLRAINGRPASPGALKELVGATDLQSTRLGSEDAMHSEIGRIKQLVKDETDAAWQAAGANPKLKPVWGPGPTQQEAIPSLNQREVGKTYNTPRGPHIWRGNGWEPVSNAASL